MEDLLHNLLKRSAERYPDRPAIEDVDRCMTYAELDARSNQMACLLLEHGVQKGDRVGLYLEKSAGSVVGIYAALKSGAAYVPLDPRAPASRLAYIARDCDLRVILTSAERLNDCVSLDAPLRSVIAADVRALDRSQHPGDTAVSTALDVDRQDAAQPEVAISTGDLAYVLYTSGSTGAPKGVMLSHLNALAFVDWTVDRFAIVAEDRLSSHAPFHFDLSIFDLFAAAAAGAAVVLVPPQLAVFPKQVRDFITERRLTVTYAVPSLLSMLTLRGGLMRGDFPDLRTVLFAGEVFPTKFLRRLMELLPHVAFFNLYGPTETNVCTYYPVPPIPEERTEAIPIGRAIPGSDVFAVTDDGTLAGPGEEGELYVGGPTVMQGYWGDEERTRRSLVPDPRPGSGSGLFYRTGDIASQGSDGDFRLIGRRDHQIKSRGYRIELGDIESALYAHPDVVECAVVAFPDPLVTNRIGAYVVTRDGVEERDLVRFCAARIPNYMIPDRFEFVSSLPKTTTGKVDRRALSGAVEM